MKGGGVGRSWRSGAIEGLTSVEHGGEGNFTRRRRKVTSPRKFTRAGTRSWGAASGEAGVGGRHRATEPRCKELDSRKGKERKRKKKKERKKEERKKERVKERRKKEGRKKERKEGR